MDFPKKIILTKDNIETYPRFYELLQQGKLKFDSKGRLRYLHGAPVGELIFIHIGKDGLPKYRESAEEWFDPNSKKAKEFDWS